jgi:hypothetical protein
MLLDIYISKLRVFQNMVLRKIFGPRRDELTGDLRQVHNKELHNLNFLPSTIGMIN